MRLNGKERKARLYDVARIIVEIRKQDNRSVSISYLARSTGLGKDTIYYALRDDPVIKHVITSISQE